MDIMKESDNDSESNHVLTYYKKYTQNPELSKYFTGPEASIKISTNPCLKTDVAPINKVSSSNDRIYTISDNPNITEVNQDEDTEHKNISPSSSIASIKKLEWDNGADIGYNNSYKCSARKSASFPSLFVNDTSYLNEENSISKNTKQVSSMYHQLTFVPEPECCSPQIKTSPLKTQTVDSSSNEAITNEHSSLSSGSEKNKLYLQKRIGQPNAYSTPYDEVSLKSSCNDLYRETPVIRGQEKPKRNLNDNNSDETSGNYIDSDEVILHKNIDNCCLSSEPVSIEKLQSLDRNKCNENQILQVNEIQKEINLCLTKPIFVECIYSGDKYNMNKNSQTGFDLEKNSKSIQTESMQNYKKIIHSNSTKVCYPQIQKIEYIKYKNDESKCDMLKAEPYIEETSEEGLRVVNNIKKSENGYKKKSLTTAAKMEDIQDITEKVSKEYQVQIDNKSISDYVDEKSENIEVVNPTTVSSNIGTNYSLKSQKNSSGSSKFEKLLYQSENPVRENLPDTSNKSATDEMILAEMISLNQSRDLNTDIKRSINILQKLLNSKKYDEATKKYYIKKIVEKIVESKYSDDSTSSSEFFRPKKGNVVGLSTQQKMEMPKNKSERTIGRQIQLMQNIPWYPVHDSNYISKNNRNIDCEVIKTDLYTNSRKVKNTLPSFAKDDVDLVVDRKISCELENLNKLKVNSDCCVKDTVKISTHQSLDHIIPKQPLHNDNTDSISDKNWKYVKTLSERLLENRDKIGQGDYLLKVATNERQYQLSWIKNEIKHLNKLKEMLERKLRPKTEMDGLISSLLKMHVDDIKGFSKNHNVFICSKCSTSKVQCKCDCSETSSRSQKLKKCANLISGYYTIQTQLDRNGNLLDLTVYDEKGIKTYNYQDDGVADNVLVTSKNRNTSVKLKPKAPRQIGYIKSKECKCCGQLFSAPPDKPEVCCCFKCENAHLLLKSTSSSEKNLVNQYKLQLQPKLLAKKRQNICTCKKCSSQSKKNITEALTTCQHSSSSSSFNYNIHFIKSKVDSKDVCNKYIEQIPNSESKCSCQKVTFREQIALDECVCRSEELLRNANKNLEQRSFITESSTVANTDTDKSEVTREPPNCDVCPRCRRKSLRCICFPRFLPKQPKLMGSVVNGPKFIQKKIERAETNRGRTTHFDSKPASEHRPRTSRTISSSSDSKSETKFPPTKKIPVDVAVGKDTSVKRKKKHKEGQRERNTANLSAPPPESPQSHLTELDAGTENFENQAKKVQCCRACKTCKSTSPRPILMQENDNKNNSRTPPSKDDDDDKNQPIKCHPKCQDLKVAKTKSSLKKGCQCCTCTDCGSQTKRFGDKNARCQCCVCENCGIQASLDGNNRKPILSKWCQPKQAKTQAQRTNSRPYSERPPYRTQIISNQFEDELDLTDESLESVSSGSTLYIIPTKYKNNEKKKMNFDCLCKNSNSGSNRSLKSQKALQVQVCPRYMKTVGRTSSITSADRSYSQTNNSCLPTCSKSLRGGCDSKVSFRIPRGVQYAVVDIACDAQQSIPFCAPKCKSGPCLPPCKSCSRKSCQPKGCPSSCETPCSKCSSSSCRPCPLSRSSSCVPCNVRNPPCSSPCIKCSPPCQQCSPPCKSSSPCKKCCSKQNCSPCEQCYSPCKPCLNPCTICSKPCTSCSGPCKTCPSSYDLCSRPCSPCKPCPSCKSCPCRSCAACKPCPPCKPCTPPCKPRTPRKSRTPPRKPRIPPCRPCTPPCRPPTPPCRPCTPPCKPRCPSCKSCDSPCRPCTPPCKPCPPPCKQYPPPCKQCPPPCKQCPPPCKQCPPPCKQCPPPCKQCPPPCKQCPPPCKQCAPPCEQSPPPCKLCSPPCKQCPCSCKQCPPPCKPCPPPCKQYPPPCKQCPPPCKQCAAPCKQCPPPCKQCAAPCKQCPPPCKQCPPPCKQYPPPCNECPPPCKQCPPPCKRCAAPCKQCPPPCKQCAAPCKQCPPPCKQCAAPCKQCSPPCKQCPPPCKQYPPPCNECPPPCKQCPPPCKQCAAPCKQCPPPCKQCAAPCKQCAAPCKQCPPPCKQCPPPCKQDPPPCNECPPPCKSCSSCKPCNKCKLSCKSCPSSCQVTPPCKLCPTPCKQCNSPSSQCITFCQSCTLCKECSSSKQIPQTCKFCLPCEPCYPKKQSSPCKQCAPPCKRCSTSSKQSSYCKQYPPCKECLSRSKQYPCPSRDCLPSSKQCYFVEQVPDSFMLRSSPSENYSSVLGNSCASPYSSASPSTCELPYSFSSSKENNSSPNPLVYMSLGVMSPRNFPCYHATPESILKNVYSLDNITQNHSQETEIRKYKNSIYFQQLPLSKSSISTELFSKKFISQKEAIEEPEEKCNLPTCAAMSLITCPFCSQSLSSNTYQNYWRPLTPKSISLSQMYESKLNDEYNKGYCHCPINATRTSISINIDGSSYSKLPCGHNTLSFVKSNSSYLSNDIQKVSEVDPEDNLENSGKNDSIYGLNNTSDTYIADESPNYLPSRVCSRCYVQNDAVLDESSGISWKQLQQNNLMPQQSASDGFFCYPPKRNPRSPQLQYYPRFQNKPCPVVTRSPNLCTHEAFNIKLNSRKMEEIPASEKNDRRYCIEKYQNGNTSLCQPVIIYSSHNQAGTDFRNSPQSANMDKWFHNQAHKGDAVLGTQPNTKSQSKKCCCALDECKCCQTSTHEAKNVQYSAFKQCLCQTDSKEETSTGGCSCKAAIDVSCECKETPCKCAEEEECKCKISSTSSSKTSSSSSSKSVMSCLCCKKETVIKNLMSKLPLCNPCHQINQKRFYPYEYSNPLHSCLCYSLVDQNTICEIKSALTEIERLDIYQQYCEVLKNCKCCKKCGCKCKLPKKFKNGCAYFLKLEDACPYNCAEEMCDCEESNGNSYEEKKESYLPEVTVKVPNCKGACARKKKSNYDIQQNCPSVMAYLCTMKPDFIERAERRRKILRSATLQREEDLETRKLRFLDQVNYINEKCQISSETKICGTYGKQTAAYGVFDTELNAPLRNIKPRVFKSFKEMKDLTRRKYLHLSEVRNKKDVYKNKRLKEANRILANTFNKRLQRSTLRGNVDIPPCVRVISY